MLTGVTALVFFAALAHAPVAMGADRMPASGAAAVPVAASAAAPPLSAPRKPGHRPGASGPRTATATGAAPLAGDREFNSCRKIPAGSRTVKLNLKPDAELTEVVAWISSITCKPFILPGAITSGGKKVTIVAPVLITPEEAYRVFLDALDSVGLTVQSDGKFLKVIETAKAKSASIPLYGWDGRQLPAR